MGRAGSKQTALAPPAGGKEVCPRERQRAWWAERQGRGAQERGSPRDKHSEEMLSELCCETHTLCGALLSSTHLSPAPYGGCATSLGWGSIQGKDETPAFRLRLLAHLIALSTVLPTPARPCRVPWDIGFSSPLTEARLYQQPEIRLPASEASIKCSKYVTSTF